MNYTATFASREGHLYRVDIVNANTPSGTPTQEVRLAYETPAELEWEADGKMQPVVGSSLTLRLIAETDLQFFADLYQTAPFAVSVALYRDGALYWRGYLDTEEYEEPYATASGYEVSVSFADFAPLRRVRQQHTGSPSVRRYIEDAVARLGYPADSIQWHVSTQYYSGGAYRQTDLSDLCVMASNFVDEDGQRSTVFDTLEAVLRPFALRIVQKGGLVHVYDLCWAYASMPRTAMRWMSDDQTLGVDRVMNDYTVTFSPYGHKDLLDGSIDNEAIPEGTHTLDADLNTEDPLVSCRYNLDTASIDLQPLVVDADYARAFRTTAYDAAGGGPEHTGVAACWAVCSKGNYVGAKEVRSQHLRECYDWMQDGTQTPEPLFHVDTDAGLLAGGGDMVLTMDYLLSARVNPWEDDSDYNHKDWNDKLRKYMNVVYVPCNLLQLDEQGNILRHYRNYTRSGWVDGAPDSPSLLLAYYDPDNVKGGCALGGGFVKNRRYVSPQTTGTVEKLRRSERFDGERIAKTTAGCATLRLVVYAGVMHAHGSKIDGYDYVANPVNFQLYANPRLQTIADEPADIETSSWLNPEAEEGDEVETIVGTTDGNTAQGARGYLLLASGMLPATSFLRSSEAGGVVDRKLRLEHLLCATAHSQYAKARMTLAGTTALVPGLALLTDASMPGKSFLALAEVQDLRDDLQQTTAVSLAPETYNLTFK